MEKLDADNQKSKNANLHHGVKFFPQHPEGKCDILHSWGLVVVTSFGYFYGGMGEDFEDF